MANKPKSINQIHLEYLCKTILFTKTNGTKVTAVDAHAYFQPYPVKSFGTITLTSLVSDVKPHLSKYFSITVHFFWSIVEGWSRTAQSVTTKAEGYSKMVVKSQTQLN